MSFNETDEELAILYKEGNKEAFKGLINRYTFPLYNFTAHIVNQNDASDVVQEIFIKTWKSIHKFDEKKASFKTWIFTIARNTAIDFMRKKKNLVFSDFENAEGENVLLDTVADPKHSAEKITAKIENKKLAEKILNKLSPIYREI